MKVLLGGSQRGNVWGVMLLWEPRDLWVGVYWDYVPLPHKVSSADFGWRVYVCLVPLVPILFWWRR
jgi:hypothetical protein